MTHDEMLKALTADLAEELKDSEKYMKMSKEMRHIGECGAANWFVDMSYDEFTHASFIRDYLEESHVPVAPDQENKLCELRSWFYKE